MDSKEKLALVLEALDEKRAVDVVTLDVSGLTLMTDTLVICTGTSSVHIRTLAESVMEKLKEVGIKGIRAEGLQEGRWVLIDYGDVIVHVFAEEERAFYRLEELLHEMRKDAAVSPQALRRKKYFNVSYLVVDEVGFEPMNREDASLFFRLVSYRYRRGSTAITTNKGVKDWPGIMAGDEAMAAAILDRLLHKSVVLNIRGRSYRLQDLEKLLK